MSLKRRAVAEAGLCVLIGGLLGGGFLYAMLHKAPVAVDDNQPAATTTTTTTGSTSTAATSSTKARLIFSANFLSGTDCRDHYVSGCDLFSADVDLDTGANSNIVPLVTTKDIGDVFPRLPASAENVLTFFQTTANGDDKGIADIAMLYDFATKKVTTLLNHATMPFPSPDGSQIFVNTIKDHGLEVAPTGSLDFQAVAGISSVHEPHVAPNGDIVFFTKPDDATAGSNSAQGMLYIAATKTTVPLTEPGGYAHCFWNASGSAAYCNSAINGGIFRYDVSAAGVVSPGVLDIANPTPAQMAVIDPAFSASTCKVIDMVYGEFCDDTHVALMAGCYSSAAGKKLGESDQVMSETVIYNRETKKFLPIGGMLAKTYAGAGTSTYTATCRDE